MLVGRYPAFVINTSFEEMQVAKARILTSNPEHAGRIQQHLTAFGFDVEIAPPTVSPRPPVELEINLEECEVQEALRRAALAPPDTEVIVAASVFQRQAGASDAIPMGAASPTAANRETSPVSERAVSGAFVVASREAGVEVPNYLRELGDRTRAGTLSAWRWGLGKTAAWLSSLAQRLGSLSSPSAGPASVKEQPSSPFSRGWIRNAALGAAAIILLLAIGIAIDKHQSPAPTPRATEVAPPSTAISAPTPGLGHVQPASTTMAPAPKHAPGTASRKLSAARVPRRPPLRRSVQRVAADRTEVVVRHFQPKRTATVQAKSDGVKRYSDWDK